MNQYHIVLIQPSGYVHTMAFHEVSRLLLHSIQSLGLPCSLAVNQFVPTAINIVLGYNLLANPGPIAHHPSVVYQLEQLSHTEGWLNDGRLEILKRALMVWEFSPDNADLLGSHGITNVQVVPIGYHEKLRTIKRVKPDIDVLFFGSLSPRRQSVLDRLQSKCRLVSLQGIYGRERDLYIARSRIILNLHFYDSVHLIEQPRIAYLLNNGCFVLSEESEFNHYAGGVATAGYDDLVDACMYYLDTPEERDRIAGAGLALLSQQPMAECLRPIVRRLESLQELMAEHERAA